MFTHLFRRARRLFAGALTTAALGLAQPAVAQTDPDRVATTTIAAVAPAPGLTAKQLSEIATRGAGWLVHWHDGLKLGPHASAWILDAKKRLIVTNEHAVVGRDVVEVFFPQWNGAKVNRDYQEYLRTGKAVRAVVIDRDRNRDLALLVVDELPETSRALKLADQPAEEGDVVRTVGGLPRGNEALWGTVSGEVRLVAKRRNANGGFAMMVVTSMPTNGGNSGGAILNDRGEVVAVVEGGYSGTAADGQVTLNVTLHVDLSELKAFLAEATPLADPTDAATFTKRAQRKMAAGRMDAASADFAAAVKRDSKHVPALVGRGTTFARKGDHATALADFDAALAVEEENFDALIARGRSRAALGRTDEALEDMTRAIRSEPTKAYGYNERGNVYHNTGKDYAAAVADYTRAIERSPTDPVLYANRAGSHERLGKIDAAIADRKKAVELDPDSDWRWNELGRVYLWKAKRYEDAFQAFKKAHLLNPAEAIHVADAGDVFLEDGQFDKAADAYTDALDINRKRASLNVAYTVFRRGLARKGLKDAAGAVADFGEAIRLNPKFAKAYYERGLLLQAAGKTDEAAADLKRAGELDPALAKAAADANPPAGPSLVGTWEFNGVVDGVPAWERLTLRADGTMSTTLRARGKDGLWREVQDSGTWTLTGDRITVTYKTLGTLSGKVERTGDTAKFHQADGTVLTYTLVK